MRIRAHRADYGRAISILIEESREGRISVALPTTFTLKEVEDWEVIEPTFKLDFPAAQSLMDELWTAGLRPSEGTGSAGSLAATEKHLKDMRAIVSKQMGIKL